MKQLSAAICASLVLIAGAAWTRNYLKAKKEHALQASQIALKREADEARADSRQIAEGVKAWWNPRNHQLQLENDQMRLQNDRLELDIPELEGKSSNKARAKIRTDLYLVEGDRALLRLDELASTPPLSPAEASERVRRHNSRYPHFPMAYF